MEVPSRIELLCSVLQTDASPLGQGTAFWLVCGCKGKKKFSPVQPFHKKINKWDGIRIGCRVDGGGTVAMVAIIAKVAVVAIIAKVAKLAIIAMIANIILGQWVSGHLWI